MTNLTKAFTMVFILIFRKGIASGKRVEAHIIVKRYSLPDLVFWQRTNTANNDPAERFIKCGDWL